jgi:hypothetical protein
MRWGGRFLLRKRTVFTGRGFRFRPSDRFAPGWTGGSPGWLMINPDYTQNPHSGANKQRTLAENACLDQLVLGHEVKDSSTRHCQIRLQLAPCGA